MQLTIRLLGAEVLHISTEPDEPDRGDCVTERVGFVPSMPVQRWEPGQDI